MAVCVYVNGLGCRKYVVFFPRRQEITLKVMAPFTSSLSRKTFSGILQNVKFFVTVTASCFPILASPLAVWSSASN